MRQMRSQLMFRYFSINWKKNETWINTASRNKRDEKMIEDYGHEYSDDNMKLKFVNFEQKCVTVIFAFINCNILLIILAFYYTIYF